MSPAIEFRGVGRDMDGRTILDGIDWSVEPDQRWVVLGPNGSGKTTLIRIAGMWLHPSRGSVRVLGEELGRTDVRTLRTRIGFASAAMADLLRPQLAVSDVVMTARHAALEPWWHEYGDTDRDQAMSALARVAMTDFADHTFGSLSSGERQRVLLARALSTDPAVVLLDEPTAALDLTGREQLVTTLDDLAADASSPPLVLVTHHVEEIPPAFTHALLMSEGRVLAAGLLDEVITAATLSQCFGIAVALERVDGRFSARAG